MPQRRFGSGLLRVTLDRVHLLAGAKRAPAFIELGGWQGFGPAVGLGLGFESGLWLRFGFGPAVGMDPRQDANHRVLATVHEVTHPIV